MKRIDMEIAIINTTYESIRIKDVPAVPQIGSRIVTPHGRATVIDVTYDYEQDNRICLGLDVVVKVDLMP